MEDSTSKTKSVKIPEEIWQSIAHESIDRHSNIGTLFSIAWQHFMALPEERREKLVRTAERKQADAA